MKISITIDILPSEVLALLKSTKVPRTATKATSETVEAEDTPSPVRFVKVADSEENRISPFWAPRIGDIGRIVGERGGMFDVQFAPDPIPCKDVSPQRFTPVSA